MLQSLENETDTCEVPGCGASLHPFIHHVFRLSVLYRILIESTSLLQDLVDYHQTSLERLGQPLTDRTARVRCTESAWTARRDFSQAPDNFKFSLVPLQGEAAYFENHRKLILCEVIEANRTLETNGTYLIRLADGQEIQLEGNERSRLHKIGGRVATSVVAVGR